MIMNTKLPSFGYQTYRVLFFPKETLTRQPRGFSINHGRVLENSFLHAEIQDDGTIKIKSKSDQNTFNLDPLNSFEWTSDIVLFLFISSKKNYKLFLNIGRCV